MIFTKYPFREGKTTLKKLLVIMNLNQINKMKNLCKYFKIELKILILKLMKKDFQNLIKIILGS